MKDVYLAPTRRLFKPTFILHNLHAVIRLSLRNRPSIIQGGWVLLGIGNNQIMEAATVQFQSEVEKKKISGECGVRHAHTYYNRSFSGIKGYLVSIWPAMNSQFSSRRPGLSDSTGGPHNVSVVDSRAAEGVIEHGATCMRLCSGPGGRMGPLFTARSLLM